MKREIAMQLIKAELDFTDAERPQFHSTHEGYAVLKEEIDELWDEIKASKSFNSANRMMINEAVQVAAMAIKFIENLYKPEKSKSQNIPILRKYPESNINDIRYVFGGRIPDQKDENWEYIEAKKDKDCNKEELEEELYE